MSLIKKLIPFLLVFSLVFYFVRMSDEYNTRILLADLGGVPWLYASVSTIFGILAAFAIQKEWDAWNALSEAVNGEVDSLEKLYLWSDHFPQKIKGPVQENIKKYTALVIRQWKSTERGEKTPEVDAALKALNDNIYEIFTEAPELMPTSFSLFSSVVQYRSYRVQDSKRHMPPILKNTLQYAAFLLILLSMFIGVKNIWLAFLFTASVASLAFSIFTVLRDLDNPLRPGSWHITTKDYEDLLVRISAGERTAGSA
ncbi:MAG: hypothetical protein WCF77_00855 [Minisyncoccia bacterium]